MICGGVNNNGRRGSSAWVAADLGRMEGKDCILSQNLGISTRRSGNHENPIDDRGVTTVSTHTTIDDYTPWMKNDSLVQIREELLKSCKMFMVMFAIDAGEEVTGRQNARDAGMRWA